MENALEAFRAYVTVKKHYQEESFDMTLPGSRLRLPASAFAKRKDQAFFFQVAKELTVSQFVPYFATNMVSNPNLWIGDMAGASFQDSLFVFHQREGALTNVKKTVKSDSDNVRIILEKANKNWYDALIKRAGRLPEVLVLYRRKLISPEFMVALNETTGFLKVPEMRIDILGSVDAQKVYKYSRFLKRINWDKIISETVPDLIAQWVNPESGGENT